MFSGTAFANEWCSGWQRGYVTGYMNAKNTNIKPIVPFCPIKPIKGYGDPSSDYEWGYVEGIKAGARAY